MRNRLNALLKLIGLAAALLVLGSCGQSTDLSRGVTMSVTSGTQYIVSGTGPSCTDLAAAKTSTTPVAASVAGWWVEWGAFNLRWEGGSGNKDGSGAYHGDVLSINTLRVTFESAYINNGDPYTYTLDSSEIANLIGMSTNSDIEAPQPQTKSYVDIHSNDAGRSAASSPYAPCGLVAGGITIADNAPSFTASVTIELVGTRTVRTWDSGGNESDATSPVRKKITTQVKYAAPGDY